MVQINFARREVNCKIVYYGPGLSGKTTNLEKVHELAPAGATGQLTSLQTAGERTLFFDFLPLDLGEIAGMRIKLQLYTVPGQVYYNSVRKLVLQGVDGIVFVADSAPDRAADNEESLRNLEENLREHKLELRNIPHVMQWNKRDMPSAIPVAALAASCNPYGAPTHEAVAFKGEGVLHTLKAVSGLVIDKLHRDFEAQSQARAATTPVPVALSPPVPPPVPPPSPPPRSPTPPHGVPAPTAQAKTEPAPAPPPRKTPAAPLAAVPPPPPPRVPAQEKQQGPVWIGADAEAKSARGGKGPLIAAIVIVIVLIGAAVAVIAKLTP